MKISSGAVLAAIVTIILITAAAMIALFLFDAQGSTPIISMLLAISAPTIATLVALFKIDSMNGTIQQTHHELEQTQKQVSQLDRRKDR